VGGISLLLVESLMELLGKSGVCSNMATPRARCGW
jgi:hypothetical protein